MVLGMRRLANTEFLVWPMVPLISIGLLCGCSGAKTQPNSPVATGSVAPVKVIDDPVLRKTLLKAAESLLERKRHTPTPHLVRQLGRRHIDLSARLATPDSTATLAQLRRSVVVIGTLYHCGRCSEWHLGISTGFFITDSGACVTSYHVVDRPETATLVAMTVDGRVHPIREVLAADEAHDLAILQVEGKGFSSLPLGSDPRAGDPVRVLSHPDGRFYTLTAGITSRTFVTHGKAGKATSVEVTAGFAKGSSGAPIIDAQGAVVAVAANTHSVYYDDKENDPSKRRLQMVLKRGSPVSALRRLLSPSGNAGVHRRAHKSPLVSAIRGL